jgi:hypothetical protein
MKNLVVAKLPKFPCRNEGGFHEEFQVMLITSFGKSLHQWKAVVPNESNVIPALSSKRTFKK